MTKKEPPEIIESKAAAYGFEIQRYSMGWATCQTSKSYIRIDIKEMENEGKSDWDAHKIWLDLKAEENGRTQHAGGTFENRRGNCKRCKIRRRNQQQGAFLRKNILSRNQSRAPLEGAVF